MATDAALHHPMKLSGQMDRQIRASVQCPSSLSPARRRRDGAGWNRSEGVHFPGSNQAVLPMMILLRFVK